MGSSADSPVSAGGQAVGAGSSTLKVQLFRRRLAKVLGMHPQANEQAILSRITAAAAEMKSRPLLAGEHAADIASAVRLALAGDMKAIKAFKVDGPNLRPTVQAEKPAPGGASEVPEVISRLRATQP